MMNFSIDDEFYSLYSKSYMINSHFILHCITFIRLLSWFLCWSVRQSGIGTLDIGRSDFFMFRDMCLKLKSGVFVVSMNTIIW